MTEVAALDLVVAGLSLYCPDPRVLGAIYERLLGSEALWATDGSVGVRAGGLVVVAQRVDSYAAPM